MPPWPYMSQVYSDLEGGMVLPACLNSELCGMQRHEESRSTKAGFSYKDSG